VWGFRTHKETPVSSVDPRYAILSSPSHSAELSCGS
jgi:hypothetical protein